MRPDKHGAPNGDLFRSSLEAILDMDHELVQLADLINWDRFDDAFGQYYHESRGRRGLRTRPPLGDPWITCRAMYGRPASAQAHERAER